MKFLTSNISKAGFGAGLVFALGSFVRYWTLFPDHDKAIAYCLMGIIVCFCSWVYDRLQNHDNEINALGDYLADNQNKGEEK